MGLSQLVKFPGCSIVSHQHNGSIVHADAHTCVGIVSILHITVSTVPRIDLSFRNSPCLDELSETAGGMRFGFPDLLPLFSRPTARKGLLLPHWTFQLEMGVTVVCYAGLRNTACNLAPT